MVYVYTRENCAYCPQVKKYLSYKQIPYEERRAEGKKYHELADTYGVTVPLVYNDTNNRGMVGFNIMQLKYVIGE